MILLFGIMADPVTAKLCARMLDRNVDFLLLDSRRFPDDFQLAWEIEDGRVEGALTYGSREIPLESVRSVCVRWLDLPEIHENALWSVDSPPPSAFEAYSALSTFANSAPLFVVNRPITACSNGSKTYQEQIILRHGFKAPRTLVTSLPEEARRFYDDCRGRVIYKSLSHLRSIVRKMTDDDLDRLNRVRFCPVQFQEYVPGVDLRVHTIGNRVFAHEIVSDATDYRYASRERASRSMRAAEIPDEIAERCLRLASELGLIMSGVDLRRSYDGEYYCFEINPTPGFYFFEQYTGQRISDALIDLLLRGSVN